MKRYFKIILNIILLSISTLSCNSDNKLDSNKTKENKVFPDFSDEFSGKINDKYGIVVKLTSESNHLFGEYSYENQIETLKLDGSIDSNGIFSLNEYNSKNIKTGVFNGKIKADNIEGLWTNTDKTRVYKFVLRHKNKDIEKKISYEGEYKDEFNTILIINRYVAEKCFNFRIEHLDGNCAEMIEGTAIIKDGFFAIYNNVDEPCRITFNFEENKIIIDDFDCSHGAACGNWSGTYLKINQRD